MDDEVRCPWSVSQRESLYRGTRGYAACPKAFLRHGLVLGNTRLPKTLFPLGPIINTPNRLASLAVKCLAKTIAEIGTSGQDEVGICQETARCADNVNGMNSPSDLGRIQYDR
jgi:hypothetical protein